MPKTPEQRPFDVAVSADGTQFTFAVIGREAADQLVAAIVASAQNRDVHVFELPYGGRWIVNFALVKDTQVHIIEGTEAGINIRR